MEVQPHLTLVDASGFIFRAYHALPSLLRPDGTPVGAVYGFCNMLLRLLDDYPTTHIGIVFDSARRTFRHEIYPAYKSHRPQLPEELVVQFPLIRQAVQAFNLPVLEQQGFEADDVIATLTRQAQQQQWQVTIVSSDKDLMQLIAPGIQMLDTLKNKVIAIQEVEEKFGVKPDQVRDLLALAGDSSDFVPGVPGIGPKTAAELIQTYGSLEDLYNNLDHIKQPKRRQSLEDNRDNAFISQRLVTLCETVPLNTALQDLHKPDLPYDKINGFLKEQGFKTLVRRFIGKAPDTAALPKSEAPKSYHLVQSVEAFEALIKRCYLTGYVSIDTETTGLDFMKASLVGISMAFEPHEAFYIPLTHCTHQASPLLPATKCPGQLDKGFVLTALKPILEDTSIVKIGHNIKYDKHIFQTEGLTLKGYDDTMVMSYVLFGAQHGHGMDELALRYLTHTTTTFQDVAGTGAKQKTFDLVPLDIACHYAAEDADITLQLYRLFKPMLKEKGLISTYYDIDRPLVEVLQAMEREGIFVNPHSLKKLSQELGDKLQTIEEKIYALAGRPFNIGSPKQLSEVLFEELGLMGGRKGKSGQQSTGINVLEDLAAQGHAIAMELIQWRQLSKLKSTYTDALIDSIASTGRVHTSFSITITNTGRLSSSQPNLQNIPIRTEEGRKIRKAFQAPPEHVLVSLDYSQIELRLLAHMADISSLKKAFQANEDIHRLTASEVFHIPLDQVTSQQRRDAKAINFGIIYGMSVFGLSQQLGIPREEARRYMTAYAQKYPGILAYMDTLRQEARNHGYVKTLWGRRCYTPAIHDKNPTLRSFAERQAINAPLQGTAADIMKLAMIDIKKWLTTLDYTARLLLQVHDELIFEIPECHVTSFVNQAKTVMEAAASLSVPLKVDGGWGPSWDEAHA